MAVRICGAYLGWPDASGHFVFAPASAGAFLLEKTLGNFIKSVDITALGIYNVSAPRRYGKKKGSSKMKIMHNGEAIFEITANRSMTLEEACELAGIKIMTTADDYANGDGYDIEDLSLEY